LAFAGAVGLTAGVPGREVADADGDDDEDAATVGGELTPQPAVRAAASTTAVSSVVERRPPAAIGDGEGIGELQVCDRRIIVAQAIGELYGRRTVPL
jgi:hypothetical protein